MVSSFLKLLEAKAGDGLDEDARNYLNFASENAERMKRMIHALVELSRVNRDEEASVPVDMNDIMQDFSQMYGEALKSVGGRMTWETNHEVFAAPGMVVKLIQKLVNNALENPFPGRPLELKIHSRELDNGFIEIAVEDNGKGIRESYQARVFEVFKQVGNACDKVGAGLTIAKAIVEKYGGEIRLGSIEGEGTRVCFSLPMAR